MTDTEPTEASAARDRVVLHAAGCAAIAFALVFATLDDPGLVWDETIYLGFAHRHIEWFQHWGEGAFTKDGILWGWGAATAHPCWGKLGIAAGMKLFHPQWPAAERLDIRAIRFASALYFGLMVGFAYWWIARAFRPRAGAMAAAAMVIMPRLFAHAHFGAIDMPMASLWFVTVALFAQAEKRRGFAWAAAAVLGLAGLTKVNAVFIPVVLAPYAAWRMRRKAVLPIIALAVVPTVMFFALWPYMWVDTWAHLCSYIQDKLGRAHSGASGSVHIETYYLAKAFTKTSPPWHYPIVMTLAATPLPFLLGACIAGASALKRRHPQLVLLLANAAIMLLAASLPFAPKYDGVRLFLPALPFLACLAGIGLDALLRAMQRKWPGRPALAWTAVVLLFALPAAESAHMHPFQLSYYNAGVGFLRGAAALGFEPTYWGDAVNAQALGFLNRECRPGAKVAFFPVSSRAPKQHIDLFKDLRSDLQIVDYESREWDDLVLVSRYGKFDAAAWEVLRTKTPVFSVRRWGVQLCGVYRRPAPGRGT